VHVHESRSGVGRSAVRLLEAFGYRVILADVGCCGRSLISTGLLVEARGEIARASDALTELLATTRADAVLDAGLASRPTDLELLEHLRLAILLIDDLVEALPKK
jgi:hypothetical protein